MRIAAPGPLQFSLNCEVHVISWIVQKLISLCSKSDSLIVESKTIVFGAKRWGAQPGNSEAYNMVSQLRPFNHPRARL